MIAATSDGDVFAYTVMALIMARNSPPSRVSFNLPILTQNFQKAFIMIAYGLKKRRSREENVDALIPPGGNDSEGEDEFLTLQNNAATRKDHAV